MNEKMIHYIEEKGYHVVKMSECEGWKLYMTVVLVRERLRESDPYKRPLRQGWRLDKVKLCKLLASILCDIKVLDHLREQYAKFPTILEKTTVCRQDIRPKRQEYS